jgi:hypothetical protein
MTVVLALYLLFSSIALSSEWTAEESKYGRGQITEVDDNLIRFYQAFAEDGVVSIYFGMGHQMYQSGVDETLFLMVRGWAKERHLALAEFAFDRHNRSFEFRRTTDGVFFRVVIGNDREAFAAALASTDIVMYQGHSRFGRGMAFRDFADYFRMGSEWPVIEVDTRNPSFAGEWILDQSFYPLREIVVNGMRDFFQYRGQKNETAFLPEDSYTIRIEGNAKDFRSARYLPGRQMFWLYSCKNQQYWATSIRRKFPSRQEKYFFGTIDDSFWGLEPAALFLLDVAANVRSSQSILRSLNSTTDCYRCFTTY